MAATKSRCFHSLSMAMCLLHYHTPYDHNFGGKIQASVLACAFKYIESMP